MRRHELLMMPDLSDRQLRRLRRVDSSDVLDTLSPDQIPFFIRELNLVVVNCKIHRQELDKPDNEYYMVSNNVLPSPKLFIPFFCVVANVVRLPFK